MSQVTISCVFPVYNEAQILRQQITTFITELKHQQIPVKEIILVENGSRDSSWHIIRSLQTQYSLIKPLRLPQASYGQALRLGIEQAKGTAVVVLNVDFYDVDFIIQSIPLLKNVDIVVGSKTLAASQDQRSHFRRLTTYFFNALLRLILNYPGTDTHGIKALRRNSLLLYALSRCRTQNELLDTEMIIRAHRWGATLVELPVTVRDIRPTRYSWSRRIFATISDLTIALWSKYLIPNFSKRIVVADDFGISKAVNQAVLAAAQQGIVHIVSILPNMVTSTDVSRLKQSSPQLQFSVHLNLVEGHPVSSPETIPSLVNHQGQFYASPLFLTRLLLGLINLRQVSYEWDNQIRQLHSLGIKLHHLDSHQHSHLFPPLWNLSLKLAQKWHLTQIRSLDSARFYLKSKLPRYLLFTLAYLILSLRYGSNRFSLKSSNEIIVHPGTSYD